MKKNTLKSWSIVSSIAMLLASALAAVTGVSSIATADETKTEQASEKVETTADQARAKVKKHKRDSKRHARNKKGEANVAKDAADALDGTGEQIGVEARKLKNKVD